jgi:hypothetical protein
MAGALNIPGLDDAPQWDGVPNFSGGMVSNARPNTLAATQCAELVNMDISPANELVTRRGIKQLGDALGEKLQGGAFYLTPTHEELIIAAGGVLRAFNGSIWTLAGGMLQTISPYTPATFVQGVDILYIAQEDHELFHYQNGGLGQYPNVANTDPPFGIGLLAWHTNRLVASGISTEPDTIYFSQFLDGSVWDRAAWNVRVGAGEGDPITALVPWTNYNLIVPKQHSIWVVDCNPANDPAEFTIQRIHDRIGSNAPKTWCQIGTDLFGLCDNGKAEVRSIKNIIASEQQKEVGPPLSQPIQDILDRITPGAVSSSCAFHWKNRYILAIPLDGSMTPNYVVVFNTLTESWSGYWTQWKPTFFASRIHGGVDKLWFGQSDGTICDWMDYIPANQETEAAFKDQGNAIPSQIVTRAFNFNEPICPKTGFNAQIEFFKSNAFVFGSVILDQGAEQSWEAFDKEAGGVELPQTLPFTLPSSGSVTKAFQIQSYGQFRDFQIKLETPADKLSIKTMAVSAFPDTVQLQTA